MAPEPSERLPGAQRTQHRRRDMLRPPEVPGLLSRAEADLTASAIAAGQLSSGMIPHFDGGTADPWNHVEAAMALAAAGRRSEAEAAYGWLARNQRSDGAWHQYYTAEGVAQDKLDANTIAYCAAGVWHHWLCYGEPRFLAAMWPVVQRALDFVLGLQTPRGEILWARHADGTPWPFALLTGSSSISHSLRCGLAIARELGCPKPGWELALARLVHTVAHHSHEAFAPKDRFAMDWYYPVLAGALTGAQARARLASLRAKFVHEGVGVLCVSNQDWVTTAETCECVMAYLAAGERDRALELFEWVQQLREPDGSYLTGRAFPAGVSYPDGERTTYSAAAVLLAADALCGEGPASGLFVDLQALPTPLDLDSLQASARD
ncbi:MAG: hypothetical protein OXE79_11020 [Acidimicrobiaceae bacterium]|nr:hypothetical protein [Acidimicrobiaceae bacterium]MCY4294193.1 hypothetical protein [Acidimicrobiaceae bacterium]